MCNRAARPWRALVWRAHHSACAMCESLTRRAQSAPRLTSRAVLWPPARDQRRGPSTPRHATHGFCGRIGATRRRYSARDHLAQRSVRCESYASSLPWVLIVSTRLCRTRANGVAHRPRYFSAARPWILPYRGAACALIRSVARKRRAIRASAMSVVRATRNLRSCARRDKLITRYGAVGLPRDGERQSCNLKVLGSIPSEG